MDGQDDKRMTFGEHLEELRTCVIRALVGVVGVALVAMIFQEELFEFFLEPYEKARVAIRESTPPSNRDQFQLAALDHSRRLDRLELRAERMDRQMDAVLEGLRQLGAQVEPVPPLPPPPERKVPEGREGEEWSPPSTERLEELLPHLGHDIGPPKSVKVTETFMSHIKIALLTACLIAAPWVLFQLWTFVGAGLYPHERKVILKVLPFSLGMFLIGMTFGYLVLVPVGLEFLLSYGSPDVIEPTITVASYLGLLFVMLFVMGMVFQIPLIMSVIGGLGVIDPKVFREKRKYFLFGGVIAAALLTPPDYVTQLLVAVPMFVLYEIGIVMAFMAAKRRRRRAESGTDVTPA